tara:strand:+ start:7997 stop:8545 length:549 start_codon:yes stop_codon:yes gene_type:complete
MKLYEKLDDRIRNFIAKQHVFFVATAPRADDGHINLSPKGYDSFVVIDDLTVAWLDLGGSGIETLAHLKENGRITIMFCAFEGAANILRLYGQGEAVQFDDERFPDLLALFPNYEKARAIVVVKLDRIQDSCGWGVPFMEFKSERDQLNRYVDRPDRSLDDWKTKWRTGNATSIDGLPGIES